MQREGTNTSSDEISCLLVSLELAVNPGLLTRKSRNTQLNASLAGIVIHEEPIVEPDSEDAPWECMICFTEQNNCGWTCPDHHRFCRECMRQHIDAVPFPRCPQCRYSLQEADFKMLNVSSARFEAFRQAMLSSAVDAMAAQWLPMGKRLLYFACRVR